MVVLATAPRAYRQIYVQAIEVRQALRERSDLHPNTITYSVCLVQRFPTCYPLLCLHAAHFGLVTPHFRIIAMQALISALGSQWEKAIEVFREQEEAARHDPDCVPNTITYSVRH